MAGHSRWAKVKHFKGAIDAKRGRIFSKLAREITVLVKQGGGDRDMNPRLRMVLFKCRAPSFDTAQAHCTLAVVRSVHVRHPLSIHCPKHRAISQSINQCRNFVSSDIPQ